MGVNKSIIPLVVFLAVAALLGWFFSNILTYLVVSMVIATILKPIVVTIDRVHIYGRGLPRWAAILLAYGVLVSIFALFILLFVPLIQSQGSIISELQGTNFAEALEEPLARIELLLFENNLVKDEIPGFLLDKLQNSLNGVFENINYSELFNGLISLTGDAFILLMAVVFITFFLLYEPGIIRRFLISMIPNRLFEVSIAAMFKVEKLLTRYLLGLTFQMLSVFTIASVGLTIVGVDYAVSIAAFAAVANLIPYLGPILGGTFAILVGISTSEVVFFGVDQAIFFIFKILTVFAIVQLTDNLFLQPFIFSRSVKAHPLEIFIIIFAGATLAGIPGMILAIPVYTLFRVSGIEFYQGYKAYSTFR